MTVPSLLLRLLASSRKSQVARCLLAVSNLESRTLDNALSVFAQKLKTVSALRNYSTVHYIQRDVSVVARRIVVGAQEEKRSARAVS